MCPFKTCTCGRHYTAEEWTGLDLVAAEWEGLELRNCASCRSTLAIELPACALCEAPAVWDTDGLNLCDPCNRAAMVAA